MAVKIKLNRAGMKALLTDPGVRADLTRRMERVKAQAEATAPVRSGDYRASMRIEQVTHDRAVVRVIADTDYSMVVEADHGTLARALDAAG